MRDFLLFASMRFTKHSNEEKENFHFFFAHTGHTAQESEKRKVRESKSSKEMWM
jgi:hypothetical protein